MKKKKEKIPDPGYFRAVALSAQHPATEEGLRLFLEKRGSSPGSLGRGAKYYYLKESIKIRKSRDSDRLHAESGTGTFLIPASVAARFETTGDRLAVDAFVAKLGSGKGAIYFVASAFIPVFYEMVEPPNQFFYRSDLRKLCNDQFFGARDENVKLTRLNCEVFGEREQVTKVTLYGNAIIKSAFMRDVLGLDASITLEKEKGPFDKDTIKELAFKRYLDPVSCRLKWDTGKDDPFPLNLDRYGNFSFYFRDATSLGFVTDLLGYLSEIGALFETPIDPLQRSDKALQAISL